MQVAAAAVKIARADEKQRPIAEIAEVKSERRDRKQEPLRRGERPERGGGAPRRAEGLAWSGSAGSHEEGMIRLKLNKGRLHGVRPNDIVGTIAYQANIPGSVIGKIRIEDKVTFVDIPEDVVEEVLKQNGNYRFGREKFALTKA